MKTCLNNLNHISFMRFLHSSANDAYELDDTHYCGQGSKTQDDRSNLCLSQWQAPKCDQVGNQVEGRGHLPGVPQPKWDSDSTQQLCGGT